MKNIYIIHHNDADGFGAAISAYLVFGDSANYISTDYGQTFPEIPEGSIVYILDYSIPIDDLDDLVKKCESVLILDHHKSAFEKLEGHPNCFFDMTRSGAGIAWDYFHPGKPRPAFIDYIEDQDLWKFSLPDSEYVRDSITIIPLTLSAFLEGMNVSIEDRIAEGKIVNKQIEYNLNRGIDYCHVIEIDEFKMLAVNVCLHQSNYGNKLLGMIKEYGCDFAGVYYRLNQDVVKFSLRSKNDMDVSLVCKRFGGGGHKQAAGFEVPVSQFDHKKVYSKAFKALHCL